MMISVEAFSLLVSAATVITVIAPFVLFVLWIIEWLKKTLW